MMIYKTTCKKCQELGYYFCCPDGEYLPNQYLKSSQAPQILIIALNPGGNIRSPHKQTLEQLKKFNPSNKSDTGNGGFYNWYKRMSEKIYNNWISTDTVIAETDLYKCFSQKVDGNKKEKLADNCYEYLHQQLVALASNLKIIICNGRFVEKKMRDYFGKYFSEAISHESNLRITSCKFKINNEKGFDNLNIHIVFAPFIAGHLRKEERRKIGEIIENIIKEKAENLSRLLNL